VGLREVDQGGGLSESGFAVGFRAEFGGRFDRKLSVDCVGLPSTELFEFVPRQTGENC